jgi:hypothetical protein
VYLAMQSAFLGADVVEGSLADPRAAPRLQREFDRTVRRGLRTFSWMIYRMTSPAMRNLIMGPENVFGVVSGTISFLAGDVFRGGPVRWRLYFFRALYYAFSLAALPASLRAWRRRKRAIQPLEPA